MPVSNNQVQAMMNQMRAQQDALTQQRRAYLQPDEYKTFLPKGLDTPQSDYSHFERMNQMIDQQGQQANAYQSVLSQNLQAQKAAAEQARLEAQQRQAAAASQKDLNSVYGGLNGKNLDPGANYNYANFHGAFDPHAPLRNYNWHGHHLELNSSVANRFMGFLNALLKNGYTPKIIGSYADRNIAGTNVKSLHSLGLAMDIDPARNPVTWNGHNITALPPGIGALAAKYGLMWGGSWTGQKRDTMHFSVPYGGRE